MSDEDPATALEQELAVLLRRARAMSIHLAGEVHPDLEPGAYLLLVQLAKGAGARLTDLAVFLGVGKPTVSRQLTVLERLGLVERVPDAHDARAQIIRNTAEGERRLAAARDGRRARFRELLDGWPTDEVAQLAELLRRFNQLGD